LDAPAAGVLLLCLGQATRLVEFLQETPKVYRAEMTLGVRTDTLDATGTVQSTTSVPHLTGADVAAVLPQFRGEIEQIPPLFSAKRQQGRRWHELARQGETPTRRSQRVTIYELTLRHFLPGEHPRAILEVTCSKGTYLRSLCADLGEALGCGALLSFLVRTQVGPYTLAEALTLEELAAIHRAGRLREYLVPLAEALPHLPRVVVDPTAAEKLAQGQRLPAESGPPPQLTQARALVRLCDQQQRLLALGRWEERAGRWWYQPCKVFVNLVEENP